MFRRVSNGALTRRVATAAAVPLGLQAANFSRSGFMQRFRPFETSALEPFFSAPFSDISPFFRTEMDAPRSFRLATHEVEGGVEVELEVPGFRPEEVKLEKDSKTGLVSIEGNRPPRRDHGRSHTRSSISSFRRQFTVDTEIFDLEKLNYKVDHGMLTVEIPFKPQPKQEQVEAPKPAEVQVQVQKGDAAKAVTKKEGGTFDMWPPKLEVVEKPESGIARRFQYKLPQGVAPENVKVTVEGDLVRVDVSHSKKVQGKHYWEEEAASFTRYFDLPEGTKQDQVVATLGDGCLTIDLKA